MKLPQLSPGADPQFVDAASCKAWLEQVPLANVGGAQQDFLSEIEIFNRFPTAAVNRLGVMEALREAVNFVQVEQAKRFMNRPLPLAEVEAAVFEDTCDLWEQMRLGYLRCLEAALNGDAALRAQAALIAQRLGAYSGLKMFHHYRAYREVPAADWASLNEVYAAAERLGVADEPVKDFLNRDVHDSSPRIAYARALLMGLSSPYELTQRQLTFVAFLLERWAAKVDIFREPVVEEPDAPPLVVDLAAPRPAERLAASPAKLVEPRYVDLRKIAKSLRNRVALLRKGESPAKLALGEDCVQPSCEQLLVFLFRQWCQARAAAAPGRTARLEPVDVCCDLRAIHHRMSGGERRPVDAKELTQKQRQELETLGHIRSADEAQEDALEEWHLELDAPGDVRLRRPSAASGRRYSHGQLIAIRAKDAKAFVLGQVRWLMSAQSGELSVGVRPIPGTPAALELRPLGLNETSERPVDAISLTALPDAGVPATLLLPYGTFKPKRLFEAQGVKSGNLRLVAVLERGVDYERVTYEFA